MANAPLPTAERAVISLLDTGFRPAPWYVPDAMSGSEHGLEFRVLGPLQVRCNDREIALTGSRERGLLALLLVRSHEVVSSDRLVHELWGEQPPSTATTALHGIVSDLRKLLEPERPVRGPGTVLVTRAPGYVLRVEPEALDSERFESLLAEGRGALESGDAGRAAAILRDALGLWRGPAFDGSDKAPSVHAEAMRLDELRFEALEERIDADLALGRDDELVAELGALVEREPLRERLRGQLMLALYRSGRQAEALELYRDTRKTFRDRLGIEPTSRLRELEQAMLRQDPELVAGLPHLRPRAIVRRRGRAVGVLVTSVLALAVVAVTVAVIQIADGEPALQGVPGSVAVVDPTLMRVVDTIEVGGGPAAVGYGSGSVWVANADDGTVSRIDPGTHEVLKVIGVGSPVDLAVGRGAIWVADGIDGSVSRIDPETDTVVAEVDLSQPEAVLPLTVQGVAAGDGAVWAALGRKLIRIDPSTNRIVASVDLGSGTLAVAAGHGSVWVVTAGSELIRLEPRSLAVTARTPVGAPVDVVSVDDGVVVLASTDFGPAILWLVDAASARLLRTFELRGSATGAADVRGASLWAVTSEGAATRVDLATDEPPASIDVGREPSAIAVGAGGLWVAMREPEP